MNVCASDTVCLLFAELSLKVMKMADDLSQHTADLEHKMQYHVQQQLGQQKQMIADELAQHRNVLVELSNMFKAVNTSPVTLPVPDQPMTISRPSLSLSRPRDCLTALPQPAAIPNAARLSALRNTPIGEAAAVTVLTIVRQMIHTVIQLCSTSTALQCQYNDLLFTNPPVVTPLI